MDYLYTFFIESKTLLDLFIEPVFLRSLFGVIFTGFIALFAFLPFVYANRVRNIMERIILNSKYINVDKIYEIWRHLNSFTPELIFRSLSWKEMEKKLDDQVRSHPEESKTYKIAFYRVKNSGIFFDKFIKSTILLISVSLFLFFISPLLGYGYVFLKIFFLFLTFITIILSFTSLFYTFKIIEKLILGDKKDKKMMKEIIKEILSRKIKNNQNLGKNYENNNLWKY